MLPVVFTFRLLTALLHLPTALLVACALDLPKVSIGIDVCWAVAVCSFAHLTSLFGLTMTLQPCMSVGQPGLWFCKQLSDSIFHWLIHCLGARIFVTITLVFSQTLAVVFGPQ